MTPLNKIVYATKTSGYTELSFVMKYGRVAANATSPKHGMIRAYVYHFDNAFFIRKMLNHS